MQLSTKQSDAFINRYKQRYSPYKDELPTLPKSKEQIEIMAREIFINALMGPDHKKKYKNTTRGQKVFNSLRLQYGPTFI